MNDFHLNEKAKVGVLGGSGFYSMIDNAQEIEIDTPYGKPSGKVALGEIDGIQVAFLPRHGKKHEYPPHKIPYKANIWALHSLGVERIIGPCAAGSLQPHIKPGDFVISDQFINFTDGRTHTFYDGPITTHISVADPYCQELREVAVNTTKKLGISVHNTGTIVIIEGSRFSTRAESKFFTSNGWEVIGMTQYPECTLARELGICYVNISLVTDYDVGLEGKPGLKPVSSAEVVKVFKDNNDRVKNLILNMILKIPKSRSCSCNKALDDAVIQA
jgi:5'-methylthioadenosine phosphorylase